MHLQPYAFHRDWLNFVALDHLPALCAAVGTGPAITTLDKPLWWPREEPGRVLVLQATPDARHCLFIDRASGFWAVPVLSLRGLDLLDLVSARLRLSTTKAAWRLAKICKLRSPMP
ncbi:hypothetical protein [Roseomonas xinghualingensis]|uniref:hypothetical protein n=1 Tax=Roseomonas xinghualingensis TaxID=2986475 RepID=UPI0021F18EC5|nr:hypothetical protein [Roseomonas sp. SXEYE001]MCV4209970.1 hypothetical protein [Roseomonas sp. SXEYE001]